MTTDQTSTEPEPTWVGDRRREIEHFVHGGWTGSALWLRALMALLLVAANIAVVGEILHQLHTL
jgi:hypothetical protein